MRGYKLGARGAEMSVIVSTSERGGWQRHAQLRRAVADGRLSQSAAVGDELSHGTVANGGLTQMAVIERMPRGRFQRAVLCTRFQLRRGAEKSGARAR